jgi:hypothetical protein
MVADGTRSLPGRWHRESSSPCCCLGFRWRFSSDCLGNFSKAHLGNFSRAPKDFERLLGQVPGARVVILRSCNYPTDVAAEVIRRNAIRIAELPRSQDHLIILDQ